MSWKSLVPAMDIKDSVRGFMLQQKTVTALLTSTRSLIDMYGTPEETKEFIDQVTEINGLMNELLTETAKLKMFTDGILNPKGNG